MDQNGYIGRKMRLPDLHRDAAIVIAAFGSSTRARSALNCFSDELEHRFPGKKIYWAYTSEIIRKKLGLPSLQQTLAQVEADGHRKAIVQPLHILPGTEYQQMAETCNYFPGLRVVLGETLMHRWEFIEEILAGVEPDFLSPEDGCNLLAMHGTPLASDPVNVVYLGLERLLADKYSNVLMACVEGVPDHNALFKRIRRENLASDYRRMRIIPMMYFAGLHVEEDLMGEEGSWKNELTRQGFSVDCPTVKVGSQTTFKGLAYYPVVINGFLNRLNRSQELCRYY